MPDVMTIAFGTGIVNLVFIPAGHAFINGKIKGEIRDVQHIESVVNDVIYGFGVLNESGFQFDVSNSAASGKLGKRRFQRQLFMDADLFPHRNVMRVGQVLPVGYTGDDAILSFQIFERCMT